MDTQTVLPDSTPKNFKCLATIFYVGLHIQFVP